MKLGDRDWSTHEVARRAKAGGYTLSNGTVQNVLNVRQKGNVSEATLRAFAYVFDVTPAEVFAVYHRTTDQDAPRIRDERLAALAADAETLSDDNRVRFEALMSYVQSEVRRMVKEQGDAIPGGKGKKSKGRLGSAPPHGK